MRWIVPLSYSTSRVIARYGNRSSFSCSASRASRYAEQLPVRLKSYDFRRYSNPPTHDLLFIMPPVSVMCAPYGSAGVIRCLTTSEPGPLPCHLPVIYYLFPGIVFPARARYDIADMRILYIAEIVGKSGLYTVKTVLPRLKKEKQIDFVIANGDGVTGGFGIGKNHSIYLRKLGVDVITGGDMTFFKKDMAEHIEKAYYMLRPANLPPERPGRGWRHYTVNAAGSPERAEASGAGEAHADDAQDRPAADDVPGAPPEVRLAVVSLLGQSGFDRTHGSNPFTYLTNVLERLSKNSSAVIVDFHALTTAEKYTMFHHADGKVTAVLGSGQRVQTADAQVFPSGTAVICDAGRTGSQNSVGGMDPQPEIKKYLSRIPIRSEESWDQLELHGAILDLDLASGYVVGFEAVREECSPPPPEERDSGPRRTGKSGGRGRNGRNGKGGTDNG